MDAIALALTLLGFGLLLIALSYQRHRHHRDISAVLHGVSGALLAIVGLLLFTLTLNFNTYEPLTDQPLAELTINKTGANTFNVQLMRIPAGDLQVFTLPGDAWQMQARVLNWRGWPTWLGLSANIRLEKLRSSRGKDAHIESISSYSLNRTPGVRLVALQQRYPQALNFLTSHTLQTDRYALQDGARYHLYFNQGQLAARAINLPRTAP